MRITFCLSHFYPIESGAERQAARQGRELVRRGHSVEVLTRSVPGHAESEIYDGMSVRRIIRPVSLGPLFGITFLRTLRRGLRQFAQNADVVHCHQALWEAAATGRLNQRLRAPTIIQPAAGGQFGEVQILQHTRGRKWLRNWILQNSFFVAISEQIEHELLDLGVPRDKLRRVGSGIDTTEFAPGGPENSLPLGPHPRFLFVGRLAEQKNLFTLIEAWGIARRQAEANPARFVIPGSLILLGDGPDRARLEASARKHGVHDSVFFTGSQTNVIDYLRAADAFVLPSFAEGMSNSLLEAMAVGLPSIVSRTGGNVDLIHHDEGGLVVDVRDPQEMGGAVIQLAGDPAMRSKMGKAARDLVIKHYSIDRIVDQYLEIYERLISER